jgi:hypothetical protein
VNNVVCTVSNDEITIRSARTGSLLWRGQPEGHRVRAATGLPDADGCIVLLSYEGGPKNFQNLVRCRSDGTVQWRAELPDQTGTDAYVSFTLTDGQLKANSWSGFQVFIDESTGKIVRREFTK